MAEDAEQKQDDSKKKKKEVGGNFSYTNSPGRFKEVLDALIKADRPDKFNRDFIETVLNIKGGTVGSFPPILKRLGFLNADNSPTDLYGMFQSDSDRSTAALQGLENGFAELFKRNTHIVKADDGKVADYLVQITGRKKEDPTVKAILGTFNAVRSFVTDDAKSKKDKKPEEKDQNDIDGAPSDFRGGAKLGLSYHINIVLPETSDVTIFNAIFKSLRENLLRD
nr:DUF5343 domain-containing protein [uncultured Sphingomonas sp.]